jgi:hypothetical protein
LLDAFGGDCPRKFQVLFKVEMTKYYGQLTPKCVLLEN